MKRLSIIVPVYNVEPFMEKCLRSLEDQDILKDDYEIICINDGSLDNSRRVIMCLQKEYDNIVLLDQENQGVSCARNNGINKANGKYLLFIDGDDYVETNCFRRILENIDRQHAQVSFLGFTMLNENGTIRKQIIYGSNSNQIYPGTKAFFIEGGDGCSLPHKCVAVLFNVKFLNQFNIRFLPDVPFCEDCEFMSRTLCLAERCIFDGHSFYQVTKRAGSAMNSNLFYSNRATKGIILMAENLKKFQQANSLTSVQREFLNHPICKFVEMAFFSARKPFNLTKIGFVKKKLKESGLNKVNLESVYGPLNKAGYLYNRSVYLLLIYHFLINISCFLNLRLIPIMKKFEAITTKEHQSFYTYLSNLKEEWINFIMSILYKSYANK